MQKEFGTKLSPSITIEKNDQHMIVCNALNNSKITLHENSNLTIIAILSKGWKNSLTLDFYLNEPNAKLNFVALVLGREENKFRFETISHHTSPNTKADFQVRTALFDKSLISYNGCIDVDPKAKGANTHLSHKVLTLSNEAVVETTPSMEIKTNCVHASHSASIGKLGEDLLFYIQTRGIDKKLSKKLLVKGFIEHDLPKEIINIIPLDYAGC